jgi:hypothetical protein
MAIRKTNTETLDFIQVNRGQVEFYLLGESPMILNAMSEKAHHELLLPKGRKSAAEKAISLKHDPVNEFKDSMYYARDEKSPTLIVQKATAFKKAAMGAALDIPGAKKAQMGRLMYVVGDEVPVYGTPEVMMSIVRSADMNKTPDVRTRAILPAWCAHIQVEFAEPMLKGPVLSKLFAAAGITQGIGDWRVEKGSGNYGRFRLAEKDDPQVKLLMDTAGREAQREAIASPVAYDSETEALLEWYETEVKRRGIRSVAA